MRKNILLITIGMLCNLTWAQNIPDISAMMTISLSHDQGTNTDKVDLVEMPSATLEQMSLFSSNKKINGGMTQSLNIYALNDSVYTGRLSTLATTSIFHQYIGVATNQVATNYSFLFSKISVTDGRAFALYDIKENKQIAISDSMTYSFVADMADTIENRFMITLTFSPDPGSLDVCYIDGKLLVNNNPYSSNIIVKNMNEDTVINSQPFLTPQTLLLDTLPKGYYIVSFGDGTKEFGVDVKPEVTYQASVTHQTCHISESEPFLYRCDTYTDIGDYTYNLTDQLGNDSVVILHLSYFPCDTVFSDTTFILCQAQLPYTYVGAKDYKIDRDSTIQDTLVHGAANECDSIATVHFLVHRVVDTISTDTTICEGSSIEWHGQLISEEGIYYDTAHYVTTLCDSVFYSINVSVHRLMTPVHTDTTICDGSSIEWHGQLISEEGIYYDTVHYATTKCDSAFYTLNVAIHRVMDTISSDTTICEGNSIEWHGQLISEEGIYYDTVHYAITKCDSAFYTLNVAIHRVMDTISSDTTICDGSSFMWRGQTCDTDSTYRDTIRYIETGCDSAYYSMKVTVHKVIEVLDKDSAICEGTSFIWRDKFLCDADSTYRDTVRYMETGCDSAYYSMKVTIHKVIEVLDEDSIICEGSSFVWRGQTCDADSTYRDTIRYIETGCDSAYYSMKVTVHKVEEIINKDTTICERSSFEWHGQLISEEGIYHDTARYVATGCDSIIYSLQVAIIPTQRATIYDTLCLKDAQIKYPYLEIEGSGTYYDTIPAQTTKCDSITTYQIQILDKDIVDSLPAVSKYNNWLLMINYNKITELGYAVAEKEVMWYQVVGEIDPASEISDDKKVGEGFYYTADKSLSSSYYAIMIDRNSICGTLMRTIVLDCSAQKSKGPRRVYTVDGQLVQTITDENVDLEQVKATKGAGLYMLRSEDGEQSETIKFIITQ